MPERPTNNPFLAYDLAANGSFTNLDPFGQMTDQNWQVNSSTVDAYQYAYDYNGNRNYRANTQSTAKSDYYTYDGLDRLTHVDHGTLNGGKTAISSLASAQDWALDELGNWSGFKEDNDGNGNYNSSGDLDQSRAHSIINETGTLTANYGASWVTPLYDNASSGYYGTGAGNMTDMPIPGNETVKESAVYDAWNRMVEIEDHTGAEIAAYAYNGLNYRVQKVDYSQSPNVTTDYIYNENWQALEEQRTVVGHSIFTYIQYVWDPRYIDAPVCRFRDANSPVSGDGTLEETLYYCNDANMNVTALVDASGTVDERYTYDAYGQVHMFNGSWTSIGTTSAYDNQILFGGYRYDPESGLYHVRNRMYHPTLGRWMSRDLLGYGDSMDLYQYVVDSPTYYTDESGDQAKTPPPPPASRPAAPAAAHDSTTPAYTVSNPWQEVDNSTGTYQVVVTWANPPFTQAILVQKVVFTVSGTSTAKGVPTPVTVDQVFEFHDQSHVATTGSEFSLTYSEAWTFDGSDPTEYISVESEKGWSDKDNKDYFSFAPPSCSSGTAKWSTQAQWTTKADQMATVMKDEHSYPPEHPFNRNTDWAEGFVHMAGTLRSRFGDSGFATGGASRTFEIAWCNQPTCTNGLTTGRIKVTSATSTPENTDWNKSVGRQ